MRHFITLLSLTLLSCFAIGCDQGTDTKEAQTQEFAKKSLTAVQTTLQWKAPVSGYEFIPPTHPDASDEPAAVVSVPVELAWLPGAGSHTATNINSPAPKVQIRLIDVETGETLASEGVIVQAGKRVEAYMETELPADFDGMLSVAVDWLDADAHKGEIEASGGIEVALMTE